MQRWAQERSDWQSSLVRLKLAEITSEKERYRQELSDDKR
jgi:hypothetical protein